MLVLIWGTFFFFLVKYGDAVKTDPCSFCAKRMDQKITFAKEGIMRIYHVNGTIEDIELAIGKTVYEYNTSDWEDFLG